MGASERRGDKVGTQLEIARSRGRELDGAVYMGELLFPRMPGLAQFQRLEVRASRLIGDGVTTGCETRNQRCDGESVATNG